MAPQADSDRVVTHSPPSVERLRSTCTSYRGDVCPRGEWVWTQRFCLPPLFVDLYVNPPVSGGPQVSTALWVQPVLTPVTLALTATGRGWKPPRGRVQLDSTVLEVL